jgi:hypothetical protein
MIDTYRRECFAIYAEKAIKVENVVQELDQITFNRGLPKRIKVDSGRSLYQEHWMFGHTSTT